MRITNVRIVPAIITSVLVVAGPCGFLLVIHAEHAHSGGATATSTKGPVAPPTSQWHWENPLPQGNNLRGASFVDADTGTVVGEYGTIIRTTNGGSSWTGQASGTTQTLWAVSFVDATIGTAVDEAGTVVTTTDGGTHWLAQTSGTTVQLRGISLSDANNGTAVGEGGTILHTTDGGNTWSPEASGTANTLFGVSFVDETTGTAVGGSCGIGGESTILRTTDGGTTWMRQTNPGTACLVQGFVNGCRYRNRRRRWGAGS